MQTPTGPIRLGIIDASSSLRRTVAQSLSAYGDGIVVVRSEATVEQFLRASRDTGPDRTGESAGDRGCDVVVLDIEQRPERSAAATVAAIRATGAQVVVLTFGEWHGTTKMAEEAGALAVVGKHEESPRLVAAIREAAAGRHWPSAQQG